jgi:hypothetical protein
MDAGLVEGEGFAVDASVIEADASRYHGKAPGEIDWSAPERQTRAVAEFLTALNDEDADAARKPPKVISPVDPCSAWTLRCSRDNVSPNTAHPQPTRQPEALASGLISDTIRESRSRSCGCCSSSRFFDREPRTAKRSFTPSSCEQFYTDTGCR